MFIAGSEPRTMKPSSKELAVANAPDGSRGRLGERGGTGGGTRVLDPGGLSHKTAGRFNVSGVGSSLATAAPLPPATVLLSGDEPSGDETDPDTGLSTAEAAAAEAPSGE